MAPTNMEVTEETRIPIKAVLAIIAVLIPLTAWALRVEWSVGTKVDKEQYVTDMSEIKNDLKALKKHLKVRD